MHSWELTIKYRMSFIQFTKRWIQFINHYSTVVITMINHNQLYQHCSPPIVPADHSCRLWIVKCSFPNYGLFLIIISEVFCPLLTIRITSVTIIHIDNHHYPLYSQSLSSILTTNTIKPYQNIIMPLSIIEHLVHHSHPRSSPLCQVAAPGHRFSRRCGRRGWWRHHWRLRLLRKLDLAKGIVTKVPGRWWLLKP